MSDFSKQLSECLGAADRLLDIIDNRFPRYNVPYPEEDCKIILEKAAVVETAVLEAWGKYSPHIEELEKYHSARSEASRILDDVNRFKLDCAYSPRRREILISTPAKNTQT